MSDGEAGSTGRNIIIYSDGTGNSGGVYFDEDRTNIYKMYRATRVCPDTTIDPAEQLAFYDPGLGSNLDGGGYWGGISRKIYNLVSQATGLGITANIIDCYVALLKLWRPGDRIFLFGFSRGAYTVRCLAAVIAFCGIPTRDNGRNLKRDPKTLRRIASVAVKSVYQFISSRKLTASSTTDYQRFLMTTRDLLAERFRKENHSFNPSAPDQANVYPYFIGVFDTVAALFNRSMFVVLVMIAVALTLLSAWPLSYLSMFSALPYVGWLFGFFDSYAAAVGILAASIAIVAAASYVYTHLKFDFRIESYSFWQRVKTIHLTGLWQQFYDFNLNPNVRYAKHAISVDENRRDFKRVVWGAKGHKSPPRDEKGNLSFEQVWFPGVHADVGGGYPENEARLSDIALKWMIACATLVPNGIKYDPTVLRLRPDAEGMQHDEVKSSKKFGITWFEGLRWLPDHPSEAGKKMGTMHQSVYDRFKFASVLQYDETKRYLPEALRNHIDFHMMYGAAGGGAPTVTMDADPIESRMPKP